MSLALNYETYTDNTPASAPLFDSKYIDDEKDEPVTLPELNFNKLNDSSIQVGQKEAFRYELSSPPTKEWRQNNIPTSVCVTASQTEVCTPGWGSYFVPVPKYLTISFTVPLPPGLQSGGMSGALQTYSEQHGKCQETFGQVLKWVCLPDSILHFSNPCFNTQPEGTGRTFSEIEKEQSTLKHVKNLVENGRITEARNVLSDIQPGSSIKLDNWKRILAKPKAKISNSATGGKIKGDVAWLHKNSSHYKGRWIALKNGVLLDSDKSRVELHRSLKQAGKLSGAMFFRIGS